MSSSASRQLNRRLIYQIFLILISVGLALFALMLPSISQSVSSALQADQVATKDYKALEDTSYISEIQTERLRNAAADAVRPVYTPVDTSIARHQLERLRAALDYISSVRDDSFANRNQKLEDIAALEDAHLDQAVAFDILDLTDTRWQIVQQESTTVLERVMSSAIRPEYIVDVKSGVPNQVSLVLPEHEVILVTELVTPFVVANSEFSEALTEAARENARNAVEPVTVSYRAGQTIVSAGQILTAEKIEALEQMGIVETKVGWKEWLSAGALVLILTSIMVFYLSRMSKLTENLRGLTLILLLFFLFLYAARFIIPAHTVIPYAFPLAAFSLTIAALFGPQLAIIFSLPLALLTAFGLVNTLDLTFYYLLGSLLGILVLHRANRLANFLWAGVAFAVSGILVTTAYRLLQPTTDIEAMVTLAGVSLLNGLVTASLAILLQFFLSLFLGTTTPMQLMDLTRPDQPLLQYILREAPGTYQHSLQVSNLAEQAAEKIGANPLLTRAGALYHDAGKARFPIFFIENQVPGFDNPHLNLDPEASSQIIIRHVTDGLKLGQKYKLPRDILSFILEHHGTMITRYQYVKAVQEAGGDESQIDKERFRYPGPRPQSLETAILMLADGCEARVRAERPTDEEHLITLVKETIDDRVAKGQLDDTDLTLKDLNLIQDSFVATLKGIYHPRIKYPELIQPLQPVADLPLTADERLSLPVSSSSMDNPNIQISTPLDTEVD